MVTGGHYEKYMKKLVLFLAVVLMAIGVKAQVAQIAVLSNEGKLSFFYGSFALIDAYEKAVDGDVITLSSGSFQAVEIKKGITIRGAGIALEGEEMINPTYITGRMGITLPVSSNKQLNFEGLTFSEEVCFYYVKDVIFQKCEFLSAVSLSNAYETKTSQYKFIHCVSKIEDGSIFGLYKGDISLINSVVTNFRASNDEVGYNIVNSIVRGAFDHEDLNKCNFLNSIILESEAYNGGDIADNCFGSNCIVVGKDKFFKFGKNITFVESISGLFEDATFYRLAPDAAKILGTDGKQVGIYGGTFPFEAAVSGLRVKKFDVSPKTTADGKLSVDIEIAE